MHSFEVFFFPWEYQLRFPARANLIYLTEIWFHSISEIPTQTL